MILKEFFVDLFDGLDGYLVAGFLKDKKMQRRAYFQQDIEKFYSDCEQADAKGWNCFFAPSVFRQPKATKAHWQSTQFVWVDYDGDAGPELPEFEIAPTYVVESSPGRFHVYWKVDKPLTMIQSEMANKAMAQKYNCDMSGWDAGQLLRVPGTHNHKYVERPLATLKVENLGKVYSLDTFPFPWGNPIPGLRQTFV